MTSHFSNKGEYVIGVRSFLCVSSFFFFFQFHIKQKTEILSKQCSNLAPRNVMAFGLNSALVKLKYCKLFMFFLLFIGSFKKSYWTVSRWCWGLDWTCPNFRAVWHSRCSFCIWNSNWNFKRKSWSWCSTRNIK